MLESMCSRGRTRRATARPASCAAMTLVLLAVASPAARAGAPYGVGNLFAAVGNGKIKEFTPAGVLVQTLDAQTASADMTGLCFDPTGNLYATSFTANTVTQFDPFANVMLNPFGTGYNAQPESCVADAAGNVYVGQAGGSADVLKFSSSGASLAAYDVATTEKGSAGSPWTRAAARCTTPRRASRSSGSTYAPTPSSPISPRTCRRTASRSASGPTARSWPRASTRPTACPWRCASMLRDRSSRPMLR